MRISFLTTLILSSVFSCRSIYGIMGENEIEAIFKQQNSLSTQIMWLTESDFSVSTYNNLLDAEVVMHDKCKFLNQVAQKKISNQDISWDLKQQVYKSLEECVLSIDKVNRLFASSN